MKTALNQNEEQPKKNTGPRKVRRGPVVITALLLTLSVSLTFLLFRGVEQPSLFSTNILVVTLVNINITLAILLVLLLSRNLIKLYFERRKEPNKSSLRGKLIAGLIGLSIIPSILLFVVASGLLTSSIENWFSIQVEKSLDLSLEVAQNNYEATERDVSRFSAQIRKTLDRKRLITGPHKKLSQYLEEQKENHQLYNIYLFGPQFQSIAETSSDEATRPKQDNLSDLAQKGPTEVTLSIRSLPEGDLVRGISSILKNGKPLAILVVDQLIPADLVQKMEGIKNSVAEYKQLKAFKNPIKGSYIISFLIIVLLIIFSATWFGLYLAKNITTPIQKLAEGTQAIAQGDLNFQIDVRATDELGQLVNAFNSMTTDLREGRQKLEASAQSLIASNKELDGVLTNIAAGVISVNEKGIITTFNPSAERILELKAEEAIQSDFIDFFSSRNLREITRPFRKIKDLKKESLEEEVVFDIENRLSILRVVLSILHGKEGLFLGYVMVFDDLTELIRAQKLATWQEVARRIAHEIRNPLTPIMLSTERLRKKYFQGSPDFDKIFDESTQIVINEVQGLKSLVDEFSEFARMPPPRRRLEALEPILQEVVSLYQNGHKHLTVDCDFDETLPALNLDRAQIKRMIVNLFENAVNAMQGHGCIFISTRCDLEQKQVRIEIGDEGPGIPPEDLDKLFLPYFSRSKSGTGLGLAIVNRIVTDHNAQIHVSARQPKGTKIVIFFGL